MNVLSLFDGISCGQLALQRANISYNNYYASEVDKHAIKVTQHHFPNTIQIGDITKLKGIDLPPIDLLIGGSPCQGFSFTGRQLNFEDSRSKLFFEYVRLLEEIKPTYFLLENVKMKKEYQDVISSYLKVEPIEMNSNLVSAQNRKRLYWTNIPNVTQPIDRNINLQNILETDINILKNYKVPRTPYRIKMWNGSCKNITNSKKSQCATTKQDRRNNQGLIEFEDFCRFLTNEECERLQTIPVNYTATISKDQRYKCIGNSFTVDVIAHILGHMKL